MKSGGLSDLGGFMAGEITDQYDTEVGNGKCDENGGCAYS